MDFDFVCPYLLLIKLLKIFNQTQVFITYFFHDLNIFMVDFVWVLFTTSIALRLTPFASQSTSALRLKSIFSNSDYIFDEQGRIHLSHQVDVHCPRSSLYDSIDVYFLCKDKFSRCSNGIYLLVFLLLAFFYHTYLDVNFSWHSYMLQNNLSCPYSIWSWEYVA